MKKSGYINVTKDVCAGLLIAVVIGAAGYAIKRVTESPIADPLVIAMIIGIIVRTVIGENRKIQPGFAFAPIIFIPVGIVFYAVHNLNFIKVLKVETGMLALLVIVGIVYFAFILFLGKILGQRKQITYLISTGSAICGASAIAITSPAVEADSNDTSISLLSVVLAALVGFSIILPFLAALFDITGKTYSLLSGSVVQFTGLVKATVKNIPFLSGDIPAEELLSLAMSFKATRFLGLLIAIPLFASLVKGKIYIPWVLWVFLISGLIGTWIYAVDGVFYSNVLIPFIKPIHDISWSIAMAAIGLNADVKELLSNNGTKSLVMAFAGFFAATATFFVGIYIMQLF